MHGRPKSIAKKTDLRVFVAAESERAIGLARRLGKRLRHQLNLLKNNGIPGEEFVEVWKIYSRTIAELGRLAAGEIGTLEGKPETTMTDAEYAEELMIITREQLQRMTLEARIKLLAEIAAADAPGSRSASTDADLREWANQ